MIQRDDSESRGNFGERATDESRAEATRLTPILSTASLKKETEEAISIFRHGPEVFGLDFGRETKKKRMYKG